MSAVSAQIVHPSQIQTLQKPAENQDQIYSSRQFLSDIFLYLRPYRGRFLIATLLRLSGDLALLFPIYAFARMVDMLSHQSGASMQTITGLLALWWLATVWRFAANSVAKYINNLVAESGAVDLGMDLTSHLIKLDISWHEKENAGNKLKRIHKAMSGFNEAVRIWTANIIEIAVSFTGALIIIVHADPYLGAALLFFILTYTPLSQRLLKKAAESGKAVNVEEEAAAGLFFEILNNIRSVKLMSIAPHLMNKLRERFERVLYLIRIRIFRYQTRGFILSAYAEIFRIAILGVIIWGVLKGEFMLGFLVLFDGYFNSIRSSAEQISGVTENIVNAKNYLMRGMAIRNEPIIIDTDENKVPFPKNWRTMRVENVSFRYGQNQVLHNLSFTLRRGEKLGIVGPSGAGKSTLFKLLLKEHETYDGEIYYDGVPLRSIAKQDFLRHMATVLQETEVFNFSIKENVLIAREGAVDDLSLARAFAVARMNDVIEKLPQRADTQIGEKGVKLSGGEKQRLGIARAIIKSPQTLFLDEATSHLDIESEEKIQAALARVFETVGGIVIAHRLPTIRKMDRILVIEGGRIVESGSFDELQAKKGRFHELWEKQRL